MGAYQIKSLIGEIAEGIKSLLDGGQIREGSRAHGKGVSVKAV